MSETLTIAKSLQPTLPVELLLDIYALACTSQAVYLKLLLVSKYFHSLVRLECLPLVPVVLTKVDAIKSFNTLVKSYPDIAARIRNLWIMGSTKDADEVVQACTNVTVLACSDRHIVALCALPEFLHTNCTRFTLTEYSWYLWVKFTYTKHCWRFFSQLTHLHLPEHLVGVLGPTRAFPSLTHLAFSPPRCVTTIELQQNIWELKELPSLSSIVLTTSFEGDGTPRWCPLEVQGMDDRLSVLFWGKDWNKLTMWCASVCGDACIWTMRTEPRNNSLIS